MANSSMIDEKLLTFYKSFENLSVNEENQTYEQYIDKDLRIYKWNQIKQLFCNALPAKLSKENWTAEDLKTLDYEDNKLLFERLQPIYASSVIECLQLEDIFYTTEWLGLDSTNSTLWKKLFPENTSKDATLIVQQVLLLTAQIEYGLGNLYLTLTKGRQSTPHLLRDLLVTNELLNYFGGTAILFLRLLLGTHKAMNMRNIVWHGFPEPNEVPAYFVGVLLLTMRTLNHEIAKSKIHIKKRPQIVNYGEALAKIRSNLPTPLIELSKARELLKSLLEKCSWLNSSHKIFWQQLVVFLEEGSWWRFVLLVLPQIELLLRQIYARANNYNTRAQLNEYYITMDTVLEPLVPATAGVVAKVNRIWQKNDEAEYIAEGTLKLLYDLFVAPRGPRIRDKVSHGEVQLQAIDNPLMCHILLLLSCELLQSESTCVHSYESVFHLNSITLEEILNAKIKLLKLLLVPVPYDFEFELEEQYLNVLYFEKFEALKIFGSEKKLPELMKLILKIMQNVAQTADNYAESIIHRFQLQSKHKTHTRDRRTLENMLAAMPDICQTLTLLINSVRELYWLLQDNNRAVEERMILSPEILKFLKVTLKIAENFKKCASLKNSDWTKALSLCKLFEQALFDYC